MSYTHNGGRTGLTRYANPTEVRREAAWSAVLCACWQWPRQPKTYETEKLLRTGHKRGASGGAWHPRGFGDCWLYP